MSENLLQRGQEFVTLDCFGGLMNSARFDVILKVKVAMFLMDA